MVHGVIGMSVIVQILVEIPAFSSEVFIEVPTEARKSAVLIKSIAYRILSYRAIALDFSPRLQAIAASISTKFDISTTLAY